MKCIVCGNNYSDEACPVCKFPVIQFPGDPEEGLRAMKPKIDAYRENFMAEVKVGIMTFKWKDGAESIVSDGEEEMLLGTGAQLLLGERFLPQSFARIPDVKTVDVKVLVHCNGTIETHVVSVPNLFEKELQEIGAVVDEDMTLRVLLKNGTEQTESDRMPLF